MRRLMQFYGAGLSSSWRRARPRAARWCTGSRGPAGRRPAGAARPAPGGARRSGCGTRWTRRGGASAATARDRARRGRRRRHGARAARGRRLRRRHGPGRRRGGGGRAGAGHRGVVFDTEPGGPAAAADRDAQGGHVTSVSPAAPLPARARAPPAPPQERCELCATPVAAEHPHLVEAAERRLLCACTPCGVLFGDPARAAGLSQGARPLPVDPGFVRPTRSGTSCIPVGMAFFLVNSAQDQSSPATRARRARPRASCRSRRGRTGSGPAALAASCEPDVEALLVRRGHPCLLVPIDACYRLVGLVRLHWRGFDGGSEAWAAIDAFFGGAAGRGLARGVTPC